MAKERLKSPRARLFVALDLPEAVLEGLAAWQREELVDEALRPSRAETLHMTLAFLGYHPEREIDAIAEAAVGFDAEAAVGPPAGGSGPGSARAAPGCTRSTRKATRPSTLQAEVERRLVEARFYEPEKRDFWPHLTVARVRPERRGRG